MKSKKILTTLLVAILGFGIASNTTAFASGGPGGGGVPIGATLQDIANMLNGHPWESLIDTTILTVTFNNNGTFTATIQSTSGGPITTDSGTWTLTPPVAPSFVANPQGHLNIVDSSGVVLLEGDFIVLRADQFVFTSATTIFVPGVTLGEIVLTKLAI